MVVWDSGIAAGCSAPIIRLPRLSLYSFCLLICGDCGLVAVAVAAAAAARLPPQCEGAFLTSEALISD